MRFRPDDSLDGVLRPLLLVDPSASLYAEIQAPDWRFAALLLFLLATGFGQRRLGWLSSAQWRALVGLIVCFYVWTWVSGNGRYFLWGLVLVGPLVVMAAQHLPGSRGLRNVAVLGVLALQAGALWTNFMPNAWGLMPWKSGPGWTLEDSTLKAQPAVFLTLGPLTYSILAPQMHPASRWANIGGLLDLVPGMREHAQLQEMLNGPLKKYAVAREVHTSLGEDGQLASPARATIEHILVQQQLVLGGACQFVRIREEALKAPTSPTASDGFLFCPVVRSQQAPAPEPAADPNIEAVFDAVEHRCPRYFAPGGARTRTSAEGFNRFYVYSEVGLNITNSGQVFFKHIRALNATILGTADRVKRGDFELDCRRMPGRYAPPWARN